MDEGLREWIEEYEQSRREYEGVVLTEADLEWLRELGVRWDVE